ncbi:MAG TPA: hypothetical protein PLA50_12340 [Bacteroidia bacterium]|nr:hypothetical protein [Bacteroidia bacterium]
MEVFFSDIPDEGLHLEGEFPESIFNLDPTDSIRPAGPVRYSADLYLFDEIVAITGTLQGPFQLQCGTCLEYFDFDAEFTDWSSEVDRDPQAGSFDLAEVVREDFLLSLPSHPRCDDYLPDRICPKADFVDEYLDGSAAPVEEDEGRNVWGALDQWK